MSNVVKNLETTREMKDSGIEWIGKIPKEWKVNKIKHCCYLKGRIGWQGLKSDEFIDEGPFLVTGTDFKNGVVNWETCRHISIERYEEAFQIQLQNDDMLVTKDGTIGKVAIVKDLLTQASLNSGVFLVRNIKNMYSTKYLYYVMLSDVFWKYFKLTQNGSSTIVHLYQEIYKEFSFPFPKKQIQQAIANYLDEKVGKIDELISEQNKAIDNWKAYKQSLITEMVTKGLNPDVEMKDSGVEWIGVIPTDWKVYPIKYVGKFVNGYAFSSNSFIEQGVRVLKISNIQHMRLDLSDESFINKNLLVGLDKYCLKEGDLIFALTRPIISSGIKASIFNLKEKVYINQRNAYFRSSDKLSSKWLLYIMLSYSFIQEFEMHIDNTGQQPNISTKDIGEIKIPLPSLYEQQIIVDFLDKKCSKIDESIKQKEILIQQLEEYKQSLIYECVIGKRYVL